MVQPQQPGGPPQPADPNAPPPPYPGGPPPPAAAYPASLPPQQQPGGGAPIGFVVDGQQPGAAYPPQPTQQQVCTDKLRWYALAVYYISISWLEPLA